MRAFGLLLCLAIPLGAADPPAPEKFLAAFATLDGGPASISPDGRHVAYAAREKGEAAVWVVNLASNQITFRGVVGKEDRKRWVGETRYTEPVRVTFLRWADNDRVVVATTYNHFLVLDHRTKTGRHLVNLNGEERLLGSEHGFLVGQVAVAGRRSGQIVALPPGQPTSVVIEATAWRPGGTSHVVLKLDVETGRADTVFDEEVAGRLIYDLNGRVRGRFVSAFVSDPVFVLRPELGENKWQRMDHVSAMASAPPSPLTGETYFGERSFPLAFDSNFDLVYFASNIGRNTFGIYGLDLTSGQRTALAFEDPAADLAGGQTRPGSELLVTDRVTQKVVGIRVQGIRAGARWLDPELAALQTALESRAPGYSVRIVDWDNGREHFVVELHNRGDPGAYFLHSRSAEKLKPVVPQRAPHQGLARVRTTGWSLQRPDGSTLTGWLMVPNTPSSGRRPIVVRLQSGPWLRAMNGFNTEVFALAQMGFAVLEVNHRGIAGFGTAHLQAGRHRFDVVAAEDIIAAIGALPPEASVDTGRVAFFGERYGGYLALRALQLHPGRFACAVTNDPITELPPWLRLEYPDSPYMKFEHEARLWYFGSDKAGWRELSPMTDAKSIRDPVMVIANPDSYRKSWGELNAFRRQLTSAGNPPTFTKVTHGAMVPGAEQARLWGEIEQFLTKHLHGYSVKP